MKNLYVFGNEFLEFDNFAGKIAQGLEKNFNIISCKSPDELIYADDEEILILDVVKGAEKTIVIDNPKQIKTRNLISLHDFDLGFFLNLMDEMGIKKNIKIIGVPSKGNKKKILDEVRLCI